MEPTGRQSAPEQPRLSVLHLLGWTTFVAIVAALNSITNDPSRRAVGFSVLSSILGGTALSSFAIWAWRKHHGRAFPVQPGEWLLIVAGWYWAIGLCHNFSVPDVPVVATFWAMAVPAAWAMLHVNGAAWRLYFGSAALTFFYFGLAISSTMFWNRYLLATFGLPLPFLIVASLLDAWRRIPRGWLHWTGVVLTFTLYCALLWELTT